MATWQEFEAAAPAMARVGRALLYQFGPGLGFLATVRADGSPRLHPICPHIVDGGLYALIIGSPKQRDLLRDGRYALHSFPPERVDDEFTVTGRARRIHNPAIHAAVDAAIEAQGTTHGEGEILFELLIERAMHAAYPPRGPGAPPPIHTTWHATGSV